MNERPSAETNEPSALGNVEARLEHHIVDSIDQLLAEEPIGKFFAYRHLPPHLQETSRRFAELAAILIGSLPRNAERTVALRKLLEGKDAAVRARL